MRITILGATGRIGGHVLTWALEAGHQVHVLARHPEALPAGWPLSPTVRPHGARPHRTRSPSPAAT